MSGRFSKGDEEIGSESSEKFSGAYSAFVREARKKERA